MEGTPMKWTLIALLGAGLLLALTTCSESDDDSDDGDGNDDDGGDAWGDDNDNDDDDDNDDNNDDNGSDDDLMKEPPDGPENPDCGGWDLPQCGTDEDDPALLSQVIILVNEEPTSQPVTIGSDDGLKLVVEFGFPNCELRWGHFLIESNAGVTCLDTPYYDLFMPCNTGEGGPAIFEVDPMLFLDGQDAPYYLLLSNACHTMSNSQPLDIVTTVE
jgi:hypothetical protein